MSCSASTNISKKSFKMFPMLHLLYIVLKYCLILTLVRLLTTAIGWEFGVSRQYLHLLELIFHMGQKRIEKVESENKLLFLTASVNVRDESNKDGKRNMVATNIRSEGDGFHDASSIGKSALGNGDTLADDGRFLPFLSSSALDAAIPASLTNECRRKVSCITRPLTIKMHPQPKTRRISTPNGPPVFLLDEDDDDDDSDAYGCSRYNGDQPVTVKMQYGSTLKQAKQEFHLDDTCRFVVKGISAIIDDQVTKRFTTEELKTWNLLTRTNAKNYQFKSRSLGLCWFLGFLVRYALLLPLRLVFMLTGSIWLICTMTLVGLLPISLRRRPYRLFSLMSFRMLSCGITSRLRFHNRQFRAKEGDICVANHTSPIDVVLLACDNCYALVGQRHGGILGLLEHALSRATKHVWFDREEIRDRQLVTQRLREHVSSKANPPVLIFPEGTCINNSAVMMFRKGSFEITNRIYPVAIKYDPRFGDPYWNSSEQSYVQYLLLLMSSWAIKCHVWYLPPMERLPDESPAEFANRVKAEIARQGGLVDLAWDGQLKRTTAKVEWKYQQQEDFVNRLKLE